MKSDDVKRAFRANRHERSIGDAPSLGRVARMAGTGLPKGRVRRRKRSGAGARKSHFAILSWSILIGVLALGGMGAAVFMWLRMRMGEASATANRNLDTPEMVVRVASKFPSPPEAEALQLVNRALAVRDPEMVAAYFRPGEASPEEIVKFMQDLESVDGNFESSRWVGSIDANGLSIDGVLVSSKKAEAMGERIVFLTPNAEGVWKADFEAFARIVKPSWDELLKQGAAQAVVRVYLAEDSYYNGPFKDDTQWVCYGMGSLDTEELLTGYCRVGSPQAEAIRWMFSKGEKLNRATLEIRRVEGGSPRQFEITRVLAEDWVMGDKPFDEGFK
jgi:hypothetical protein